MIKLHLFLGLFGAFLMFIGDMCLYFNKSAERSKDYVQYAISVMKHESRPRLYIAGLLGPVSALFFCFGFYHIMLITVKEWHSLALASFIICCFGIIIGGAFHSHCSYLGLISRHEGETNALKEVLSFLKILAIPLYASAAIGSIMMSLLIVLGKTSLPAWYIVFTPIALMPLKPLASKIPGVAGKIISGGYGNLIYVLYYAAALIRLCR